MFSCKVGLHEILLMSIYMFFVSRDNVSKSAQTFLKFAIKMLSITEKFKN